IHKRSKDSKSTTVTSKSTNLRFKHVPSEEVTVPVTGNVVLQCEAGGNPPPKIHWLKNGERVVQNVDEFSVDDDSGETDVNRFGVLGLSFTKSRLFLDCVQPQDVATYTCVAENQYTRIFSDTVLNVVQQTTEKQLESVNAESSENSISRCVSKKSYDYLISSYSAILCPTGSPARIHMWTVSRLEMMGSSVQLYCRHSGAPHSSLSWTGPSDENKVIRTNGRKYHILENGDLVINDLAWEDMGSYSCHVRNQHGSDKVSTFLYPTAVRI
ncbi:neural/ectodermal development factor IMP-L2-like protein, partial [Leptotrombidium deliense]